MRLPILFVLASAVFPALSAAQAPVFEIVPVQSSISFHVKASTTIAGKFDKWDATLTFTSPDETTGVLEIIIQAASVQNT
jgi:polyisoprenoid-binding protein YceI